MDSVRFGRALGFGARSAARALAGAAEAAAAPNPGKPPLSSQPPRATPKSPITSATQISANTVTQTVTHTVAQTAARATIQARQTRKGFARGGKRFGESVWGPFARLSRVLWLEITGSFFAIFALFAANAVWSHRADLVTASHATRDARLHLLVFLAMTLVFAYFSITSFLRAYRK